MTSLDVSLVGDGAWPDAADALHGDWTRIARMANGTTQGKPAVIILVELPDGRKVVAQTTLALLKAAVNAFDAVPQRP